MKDSFQTSARVSARLSAPQTRMQARPLGISRLAAKPVRCQATGNSAFGARDVTDASRPVLSSNNSWEQTLRAATPAFLPSSVNKEKLRVFSGTSNTLLAEEIAMYLGLDLSPIKIKRFADGEIYTQVGESIRGCDVFLVQPTCPPVNDNLMELLGMVDAS